MKQSALSVRLKIVIAAVGIMGLLFFFLIIPLVGRDTVGLYPEYEWLYVPGVIYIWVTSVPVYIALYRFWLISREIGRDNSFCAANAKSLNIIGIMALADTVLCFAGGLFLFVVSALNLWVLTVIFFLCAIGAAVSVISAALSHLVEKACAIKEENDLTI